MITYNPKSWFKLIFQFHKSDTFRKMFWVLVLCAAYTGGIVYAELTYSDLFEFKSTIAIHSLLGFVIGLLLVFRTNSAYDRWWEGRKQWGSLVNNTRNFAIKLNAVLPHDHPERGYFKAMIANYPYILKEHLRNSKNYEDLQDVDGLLDKLKHADHGPNVLANDMYRRLHELYRRDVITGDQLITLDKEMKSFTDILGACERIKNTPIPYSYNLFLKKFIFAYVFTMPFGLVFDFKYWSVPIVTFILYVFGSLELLAEEIEDPFGLDTNDLPTDDLAVKIRKNIAEIL